MIKGAAKSIIEMTPNNNCFEKIIVILNSDCDMPDPKELHKQLELLTNRAPNYLIRQKRSTFLKIMLSSVLSALITSSIFLLLYVFV